MPKTLTVHLDTFSAQRDILVRQEVKVRNPTVLSTLYKCHIQQIVCTMPKYMFVCLFVALRPKSTAMVIVGRSVHLTTLFPGQA